MPSCRRCAVLWGPGVPSSCRCRACTGVPLCQRPVVPSRRAVIVRSRLVASTHHSWCRSIFPSLASGHLRVDVCRRRRTAVSAVSSGFKSEAMPIKNHDVQSLIRWIHVPSVSWRLPDRRTWCELSLIAAAPADGAGLERRHPRRDSRMGSRTHTVRAGGIPPLEEDDQLMYYKRPTMTPLCLWPYKHTGQVRIGRGYRLKGTAVGSLALLCEYPVPVQMQACVYSVMCACVCFPRPIQAVSSARQCQTRITMSNRFTLPPHRHPHRRVPRSAAAPSRLPASRASSLCRCHLAPYRHRPP